MIIPLTAVALVLAFQALNLTDALQTMDIRNHPNLREGNPLLRWLGGGGDAPSDAAVALFKGAVGAGHVAATALIWSTGPAPAVGALWAALTVGFGVAVVAWNAHNGLRVRL